eukprot:gene10529-2657_t
MGRRETNKLTLERTGSFLTAPEGGWLHSKFALKYGEGVFYSFPVTYIGRQTFCRSLRSVEFPLRNKIVREAISRVREASGTRRPTPREQPSYFSDFFPDPSPDIMMEDIYLNISSAGIAIATGPGNDMIAFHRMSTISFAAGGDFEDYDMVAYVAKSRLGRMCYVFDCGSHSNQVLATIGQAFVEAGEELEAEEYEDLDHEYGVYAHQLLSDGTNRHIYGSPSYQQSVSSEHIANDSIYADPEYSYELSAQRNSTIYDEARPEQTAKTDEDGEPYYDCATLEVDLHDIKPDYDNRSQHSSNRGNIYSRATSSTSLQKRLETRAQVLSRRKNKRPSYAMATTISNYNGSTKSLHSYMHMTSARQRESDDELTYDIGSENVQPDLIEDIYDNPKCDAYYPEYDDIGSRQDKIYDTADNTLRQTGDLKQSPQSLSNEKTCMESNRDYIEGEYLEEDVHKGDYLDDLHIDQSSDSLQESVPKYVNESQGKNSTNYKGRRGIRGLLTRQQKPTDLKSHRKRGSPRMAKKQALASTRSDKETSSIVELEEPAQPAESTDLPKRSSSEMLLGSIRSKPLRSKGDFLVRKLNAESGTLSQEETASNRMPSWNFIDPQLLSKMSRNKNNDDDDDHDSGHCADGAGAGAGADAAAGQT